MAHDLFISYSSPDNEAAEAICSILESRNISCWFAPRDIPIGKVWVEEIVDAIDSSRIVILILSINSNSSSQVVREVERAAGKDIPIIPIRIDNAPLSKALEFFTSRYQWLDARKLPIENHLQQLTEMVQQLLTQKKEKPVPSEMYVPVEKKLKKSGWFWAGIVLILFSIGVLVVFDIRITQLAVESDLIEMFKGMLVFSSPLFLGTYFIGRGLTRSHPAKHTWLWQGIVFLIVGLVLLVFSGACFTGIEQTDREAVYMFAIQVCSVSPLVILAIYCFIKGFRAGRKSKKK